MFPRPLLYNSYHALAATFSFNQLSNAYYTLKPLSSPTREQNLRLTEKTPGSDLEKRYREYLAFQAFLYSFMCSSTALPVSVSLFISRELHLIAYLVHRTSTVTLNRGC